MSDLPKLGDLRGALKPDQSQIVYEAARLRDETMGLLREVMTKMGNYDRLILRARRQGFIEACDRMGLPESETPMERIALGGGNVE